MTVPQRTSLVDQVVDIIRERLQAGEWKGRLSGEHELCAQLQISRPTLRKALSELAGEGWVRAERGVGWRILARPARAIRSKQAKKVGILCFVPLNKASHFALLQIDELQDHLHRGGYPVEIHAGLQFASQNYRLALARLMDQTQASHWILIGPTTQVLEWFVDRGIPAFASLTAPAQSRLPCLTVDLQALYRHAVGMLVRLKHERLGWFVPRTLLRPEESRTHGFWDAVAPYQRRQGFAARMITHRGTPEDIRRTLDHLFSSELSPTALLVLRPHHALAVVSHLVYSGVHVPRDVSVVCIGYDPILENVSPSLVYYTIDGDAYIRRLCRVVLPWLASARAPSSSKIVLPQFHGGQSVAERT